MDAISQDVWNNMIVVLCCAWKPSVSTCLLVSPLV